MRSSVVFLALFGGAAAQSPNHGIAKSTYACDDPLKGKAFMYKYFPVQTPGDECDGDICTYPAGTGGDSEWYIQLIKWFCLGQKPRSNWTPISIKTQPTRRASDAPRSEPSFTEASNASATQQRRRLLQLPAPTGAGKGFGLHLVNVSNHLTTGGRSVAAVEGEFNTKLSGMSEFDAFMDYNVMRYTSDLAGYVSTFKADSVPTYAASWSQGGKTYTSVFVQVQGQAVLELTSDQDQSTIAAALKTSTADLPTIEPRVPEGVVDKVSQAHKTLGAGVYASTGSGSSKSICTALAVNRAVSEKEGTLEKMETFYVTGMGTTKTTDASGKGPGTSGAYSKKCFLWPGATVHVCFTARPDTATKGGWKVGDFEKMMNKVHETLLAGQPYCSTDKWFDNHYAIDSYTADTAKIVSYVDSAKVVHYCSSSGPGGGGLHYIFDPSGWGIQTDMNFGTQPSDCSSSAAARPGGQPACDPGTCK